MKESSLSAQTLRFGVFEFDPRAGELRKQGMKIRLQGQPIDILALLLERPGEVVTREELQKRLWPANTFVDFEQGLNAAMKRLRAALDDDAENPRFIETLPRHGYRFIASVDRMDKTPAAGAAPISGRLLVPGALAAIAIAAALVGLNVRGVRNRLWGSPHTPQIRSIAVLPLANLSGNPEQDYFADGMTDALITELGKIGALRVISRQSVMRYKSTQKTPREIARELGVDGLVEGSVQRSADRVRVSVNLIDAPADQHVWAEMYDRDLRDILTLQSDFAQAIARQIRIQVTPREQARVASTRQVNPEAYQLYLKGRYFTARVNETNVRKSIEYFEQAVQKDPTYAAAYVGLGEGYGWLGYIQALPAEEANSKMKALAMKALEIDETLGEAHAALGTYNLYYKWDGLAAEQEFKRAIELSPNYPDGYQEYSAYLAQTGQFDEALAEIKRARELDPLSPFFEGAMAQLFYLARRYDRAIEEYRNALELDPNRLELHSGLGWAYLRKGMLQEAVAEFKKQDALRTATSGRSGRSAGLGYAYALAGRKKEAQDILAQLKERPKRYPAQAYGVAIVYMGLGDKYQAFAWLERAYEARTAQLRWLKVDPSFDPLHSDPRFQDLLRRVGLSP